MNIAFKYYPATYIMRSRDPNTLRIIDLWTFRSTKSNKRYIVEVEAFDKGVFGLKFYWEGVAGSSRRYSFLTYDYEPRTIIFSCIQIMMRYFDSDNCASFGFIAAPDLENRGSYTSDIRENKRFRFYRRLMLSLFGAETFVQVHDINNVIYFLINKKIWDNGELTLKDLEDRINEIYAGEYALMNPE